MAFTRVTSSEFQKEYGRCALAKPQAVTITNHRPADANKVR